MDEIQTIGGGGHGYRGDVQSSEAWRVLRDQPDAELIDVRTSAEWAYVGVPDLSALNKKLLRIEWQAFPEMVVDPQFGSRLKAELDARGATAETPVFFICRSGARSAHAARAASAAGYRNAFNVASGFEGDRDDEQHRGRVNGWKVEGLPWIQN